MKRKLITSLSILLSSLCLYAGTVNLSWSKYQGEANVYLVKVYAVKGTNTAFSVGNTNASFVNSTSSTNTSISMTNLSPGAWTFTATTFSLEGEESVNSNTVWTNVPAQASVVNLKVTSVK